MGCSCPKSPYILPGNGDKTVRLWQREDIEQGIEMEQATTEQIQSLLNQSTWSRRIVTASNIDNEVWHKKKTIVIATSRYNNRIGV